MSDQMPTTMTAAVLHQFADAGPAVEHVPVPLPGRGQVRVRVVAAGLNPVDVHIRGGRSAYAQPRLPAIVGTDVAGVVDAVGASAAHWRTGDRVFGLTGGVRGVDGALAQYQVVDAELLARVPDGVTLRAAASVGLVSLTAWDALDWFALEAGTRVLVHGGAGGVGHVAVQIARARGAEVFATASARDRDYVRGLGGTVIDYRSSTVTEYVDRYTDGRGFDAVFDTVGGATLRDSFAAARDEGRVASCMSFGEIDLTVASVRGQVVKPIFVLRPLLAGTGRQLYRRYLEDSATLLGSGALVPRVDERRFSLATLEQAYTAVADGSAASKIVVDIDPSGM